MSQLTQFSFTMVSNTFQNVFKSGRFPCFCKWFGKVDIFGSKMCLERTRFAVFFGAHDREARSLGSEDEPKDQEVQGSM